MATPREVRIAIGLSLAVLVIDLCDSLWHVLSDAEAKSNATLAAVWVAVLASATLITGFFIYKAARRRNWARIALLSWTVGSWLLWLVYPQRLEEYSLWGSLFAASLLAMELAALYLLFIGKGGRWYTSAAGDAL